MRTLIAAFVLSSSMVSDEFTAIIERERRLRALPPAAAGQFVTDAVQLAADATALGERVPGLIASLALSTSVTLLGDAASVARFQLKDSKRAMELYQRAAATEERVIPGLNTYADEIADIHRFDLLNDRAAAARLKELRERYSSAGPDADGYYEWLARWLDAEIACIENKTQFRGDITARELSGFVLHLQDGMNEARVLAQFDPTLHPFRPTPMTAAETEKKLLELPASHSMFSRTWMLARHLPTKKAAQKWLARNDPSGFLTDSMLTLIAALDRTTASGADPRKDSLLGLARRDSGEPTVLALMARDYAKTHRIPAFRR